MEGIIHCQGSNKHKLSYPPWVPWELLSSDVSYKLLANRVDLLNLPQVNTSSGTEHSHCSYHTEPFPSHTNSTRHHGSVLCCAIRYLLTLPSTVLCIHRTLKDTQSSWDLRERHVAKRQHGLAQNGLGDPIKLFVSTVWFSKMHIPRKHHSINTCAPNHLPQPLLAENHNVRASNPTGTTGQAPANAVAGSKGLSTNSAFTFIGSLNLLIASELAGMKEKSFLKNPARMNFHSSWSVFQQVPGGSHW